MDTTQEFLKAWEKKKELALSVKFLMFEMVHELLVQQENKDKIICCGTDDLFFKLSSSKTFLSKSYTGGYYLCGKQSIDL